MRMEEGRKLFWVLVTGNAAGVRGALKGSRLTRLNWKPLTGYVTSTCLLG